MITEVKPEKSEIYHNLEATILTQGSMDRFDQKCLDSLAKMLDVDKREKNGNENAPELQADKVIYFKQLVQHTGKLVCDTRIKRVVKETGLRMGIDIFTIQKILSEETDLQATG